MLTATITALEYQDAITINTTTPLGETSAQTEIVDQFVATFDCGSVTAHPLHFSPEAIGNRLANYPTITDAVTAAESLVRELVFAWSPSLTPADPTNPVDVNGGTDSRIDVAWTDDATKTAAVTLLATFADRIAAAEAAFAPQPSPVVAP